MKERLIEYLKYLGIGQNKFENNVGWSSGFISHMKNRISAEQLRKLSITYPELNQDWLLYGEGTMLKMNATAETFEDVEMPQPATKKDLVLVPVLNLDARGGYLANDAVDVEQYVTSMMPFERSVAREGDVVIPVYGDSMSPEYPSGCLVLIRPVEMWKDFLELSLPYVIELKDGRRLIKKIEKGEDSTSYTLHSVNPDFADSPIKISVIANVWQVVMMMRKMVM